MRLVVIGKHPYAVGLLWFTPDNKDRTNPVTLRKLAGTEAERQASGLDLVAFRHRQFGLGSSVDTSATLNGTRSLAAALQTHSSFIGLFKLEDVEGKAFWWVYACTSGVLSEQADALFESYEEAKMYIHQSLVSLLGEFDEQVECDTCEASHIWLAPLLGIGLGRRLSLYDPSRLTPIRQTPEHRQKIIAAAVACAFALVGLYVVSAWFEHQAAQQALEAARLATLNKERRRQELEQHPERAFPPVWTSAPRADQFASVCLGNLFEQPVSFSGWELVGASCTGTTQSLTLEHRPGADFQRLPRHARLVGTSRAVLHTPLSIHRTTRTDTDVRSLLSREPATRFWYQLTQQLGSRLRLDIAPPAKTTVDGIELIAPWQRGAWELTDVPDAVMLDGSLLFTLARQPGLVVEQIAFADNLWTLKGAMYVQK